jgi:hypothetical protein
MPSSVAAKREEADRFHRFRRGNGDAMMPPGGKRFGM